MNDEKIKTVQINILEDRELALKLFYQMSLIRSFEEKSAEMYTKGKIRGFLHLYTGEEAVAVGIMNVLTENDNILSTYREHGHALARGIDPGVIMAEMYGKKEGCSGGRGGSMHIFDAKKKFYGGNAIVAGHLPMTVGLALADKKMKRDAISCCFFGEGAIAEGEFHEAMNLASLWKVPALFICENNLYAMGTAIRYSHAQIDLEKKAIGYNMEAATADGMDVYDVLQAAKKAVEYIRKNGKPYLLICNTFRFRAHSMFDAELYRDKNEVTEWKKRDPISTLSIQLMKQKFIDDDGIKAMNLKIDEEIQKAVDFAEKGTLEPVEDLTKFVYSTRII